MGAPLLQPEGNLRLCTGVLNPCFGWAISLYADDMLMLVSPPLVPFPSMFGVNWIYAQTFYYYSSGPSHQFLEPQVVKLIAGGQTN